MSGFGVPPRPPGRQQSATVVDKASQVRAARAKDRHRPYRTPDASALRRRARLEKDPAAWLQHYLPERFPLPFGGVHLEIIKACVRAMTQGTSITVAAPRGFGKTALLWGMSLYGVMTGLCRFPVVIGWKANAGLELLDQWLQALSQNDRLGEAYPCACDPFRDSIQSTRLKGILRETDPEKRAGCDVRKGRGMVLLPDSVEAGRSMPQAALAGASMNGSIKGLNVGLLNGESLRPDIVLMDDPQDEHTADSAQLVKKVIKKIDYGVRSLSGPRRRLTVMSAVTCVNVGDVAEHLLTRPGTEVVRAGQIVTWPKGWTDKQSQSRALWDEWNTVRLDGLARLDGGRAARAHYKEHREALTDGMSVSWDERRHIGDGRRASDPDALFAAMWDFYDLGEFAFMAERQNAPMKEGVTLYNLTPSVIESRTTDRAAGVVPEWVRLRVAATDINPSYGLTWAIVGFGADQSAAVIGYGVHEMSMSAGATDAETWRAVYEALVAHGRKLASFSCRPETWIIDAGGAAFDTVLRFAVESARIGCPQAIPSTGRGARTYKPWGKSIVGKPREYCHLAADARGRKWVAWNSDYWREVAQKGWTGSIGAPGACNLPAGSHQEFAAQICREQLSGKGEIGGQMMWNWHTAPGPHDYGDCMAMAYMGAAWAGIGTSGAQQRTRAYVERRKCKVAREI